MKQSILLIAASTVVAQLHFVGAFVGRTSGLSLVTKVPSSIHSLRRKSHILGDTVTPDKDLLDPLNLSKQEQLVSPSTEVLTVPPLDQEEEEAQQGMNLWAARGLLLLVAAIWGTNFACVKYLESLCFHPPCNHPPSEFAFARFGLAALVSFPLLVGQRKDVILAGLECGLWIMLGYTTQALALSTISAGKCAFICSLTVVFVPILALVLYGRPIKMTNVVAAVIALTGVGVLEGMFDLNAVLGIAPAAADTGAIASSSLEAATGPLSSVASSLGVGKGDLLALGQPIGFGYSFLRIEHYQEKFKDVPNRVLTIAAAQCVAVGTLALLWVLKDYNWVLPDFGYLVEPHRMAAIAWTGIVTTVVAIFLEGIALQTATANDAAITFSSEPVWASIFGFLLLHEKLGVNSYIGGAIILVACLVGSVSDMVAESEPPLEHHLIKYEDDDDEGSS